MGERVKKTAYRNLKLRYSLLKFFYSIFVKNNGAGVFWKPLFFNFPDDENCYDDKVMNEQFMIGDYLLAAPGLYENVNIYEPYFPSAGWNDLLTGF